MKKLWNRIANIFSVIAVCVIAGCNYAGDGGNNNPPPVLPPAPAPEAPVKYTITYDAAGHGEAPEAKTVEKGYKLTDEDLQVLTADGFDFGGWKFNEKIAAAGEEVVSDMTLVAVWTEWGTVASPTFSVAAGEVDKGTKVSIFTTTEGASIYYTTDGSAPTAASIKYESEIEITADVTIKAIAVKEGCKESEVAAASYTIKLYTITFDANGHGTAPDAMTGYKGQKITLPAALTETGVTFDKWTDGTTDYAAGLEYTVNESVTLKAKWVDWNTVASPSFSVTAGEVDYGTKVSIFTTTEGASIYYTTDGSEPTTASTKYESEIEITAAVTIKAIAVKSGLKDSEVVSAFYTVDVTPPAAVTNLTAKCTARQTIKLTWTNPADADFAKVVITYGTTGKVEVLKNATPNNEATVIGLTNDTEYTFTVNAYDNAGNVSSGVNKKCTPFLGKAYNATNNGGLEGYTNQTQGKTVKEIWMANNGNLKINGTEIAKTSEVVAIPAGTVATVTMPDDSSWSGYVENKAGSGWKGVFLKGRKVKLDPFVMSQYQVTEQLWTQIMGGTATISIKPKTIITWYEACAFCNELTKKTMTESDCVYYSDEGLTQVYESGTSIYAAYDTSTKKWTKKGYRLPTEAEWEFAARGGDPNAQEWKYAYAGVKSSGMIYASYNQYQAHYDTNGYLESDANLSEYAVYYYNSDTKADVGTKKENKLYLYDMSGNVKEWCYDWYNSTAGSNDSAYTVDGYVQNPVGASASGSSSRCCRGGEYSSRACKCAVSCRGSCTPDSDYPDYSYGGVGFRVVRSISIE